MTKFLLLLSLISFYANTDVARASAPSPKETSLTDLFGDMQPVERKDHSEYKTVKKDEKKEEKKDSIEENSEEKKDGIFSFLNFSFFQNKDKAKELSRQVSENQETYMQRMERLAEEGDVEASLTLGFMYLYGENGVENDNEKAFKYYSMAASQNDDVAINNVGSLYFSGIGTKQNTLLAAKMFDKAAKLGNAEAAVNLAFIYLTTPKIDYVKNNVIDLFEQAADKGNITAIYMLGHFYKDGFLVEQDYQKAFDLFEKAAQAEYDEAEFELAMRYIRAEGTPRNYGNAVKYLIRSSNQGNLNAMVTLGNILAAGTAYPKNEYQAYIWFNIASVYDVPGASEKRDILEEILKIEEVLQAQAASESFVENPSEVTHYIRQTFGRNISSFITN